ncbi:hypothetical protein LVB87_07075 [Lysobacter sp. KIS68-7]|uniref:hypothetical protein n=1 Tax=Lysobacter sp. KIS68-7 TaxID=2904252 RepID=UPI001E60D265|nr:hypothetical protein [Lysobacter sp. KIS68-7]UHQ20890.1 hypothetical protein LVB87_07075 [Lysobacter sp. KIS68-7]
MSRRNARSALVALSLCCLALGAHAADRSRVVNEGGIRDQWMLADGVKLAAPGFTPEMKDAGNSVCVAIGYSISPEGKTGDFTVLRTWTSQQGKIPEGYYDQYTASAAGALSQWAFKPRPEVEKAQRTVTVATMTFVGKDAMDRSALASNCKIADLAAALQEAGHKNVDRDQLRRELERSNRASTANNSMISNPAQSLSSSPVR